MNLDELVETVSSRQAGSGGSGDATIDALFAPQTGSDPLAGAYGRRMSYEAQNEERQRAAAKAAEEAAARNAAAKTDPKNYQMLRREDGGFDFWDPEGNAISAFDYAQVTGNRVDDILAESDNPRDRQFALEYKTLRDIQDAFINEDAEKIAKYRAADPERFNQLLELGTPDKMIDAFQQHWGEYFNKTPTRNADRGRFAPGAANSPDEATSNALMATPWEQLVSPVGPAPQQPTIWDRFLASSGPGSQLVDPGNRRHEIVQNYSDWEQRREENPWIGYTLGR